MLKLLVVTLIGINSIHARPFRTLASAHPAVNGSLDYLTLPYLTSLPSSTYLIHLSFLTLPYIPPHVLISNTTAHGLIWSGELLQDDEGFRRLSYLIEEDHNVW